MAPAFSRSGARSGRTNRNTGFDHDIVEGLPIRHWRRDNVTVAPPSHQDLGPQQNDKWAIELPHGMPKDSHLLPLHSQELLRAARSGRLYKRTAPVEDEEVETTEVVGEKVEKLEKKEKEIEVKGFTARTWKQVPKHLEGSEFEYLAARRKGLVNPKATTGAGAQEPALTKATVKRTDASGKVVVEDMVLKEGDYVLNGEILAQTVIPNPVVPETPAVVATPVRRKPPPPKRKAKGPGRGRRKKVQIVEGTNGTGAAAPTGEQNGTVPNNDVKTEPSNQGGSNGNEDTEMGGEGENQSDDEEGDEEGDDDEDGEDETPNPTKNPSSQSSTPVIRTQTPILPPQATPPSTVKQSLAPVDPNATSVPSPLSQSSVPPPTLAGDSIMQEAPSPPAPAPPAPAPPAPAPAPAPAPEPAPELAPEPAPEPAPPAISQLPESTATSAAEIVEEQTHSPIVAQQEEEDIMLLDTDMSNIQEEQQPIQATTSTADDSQKAPEISEEILPAVETMAETAVESGDGGDDFIDYLGNLEKSLDQHDFERSDINTQDEMMEDAPAPSASVEIPALEESVLESKSVLEDEKSAPTPVPETTIEVPVVEDPSIQTQTEVIDEQEKPIEPEKPAELEEPAVPEEPVEPEVPAEPAVPVELEVPVEPKEPVEPEVPVEPEETAEPAVEVATAEAKESEQSISEPIIDFEPSPIPVPSEPAEAKADLEADVVNTEPEPETAAAAAAHESVPEPETIVENQPEPVKESAPEQPAESTLPVIESLPVAPTMEHELPTKPAVAEPLESESGNPTESTGATEVTELLTGLPTEAEEKKEEPATTDLAE